MNGSIRRLTVTILLVLCLSPSTLGQRCPPRQKPSFDCITTATPNGVFFPHPSDCTFLIVCLSGQDVAVSLCEETDYRNLDDPQYSLGCPQRCDEVMPPCQEDQQQAMSPDQQPYNLPRQQAGQLPPSPLAAIGENVHDAGPPTRPPTTTEAVIETQAAVDASKMLCQRSGIVAHPYDCMKAFICTGARVYAIQFNICENIHLDSTFPVGCPELCPGWLPGVMVG